MPVVAVFQSPSLTQERYEESVAKLAGGKSRMESPADWPVEGLLAHVAGQGANGFRVVDVWESEEAFQRFGETLMPVLQDVGVQGEPEVYPTHTFVSA
jgi:thiamine pyrophosphate-dependent acetolactate synthase large subunit-like protein